MKQEYNYKNNRDLFKSHMLETKSQVESELTRFVAQISELSLHPQIKYAALSKGKRLRPLLVILSAESVGGKRSDIMRLALSFELMHTATLIHDDIIDQDETRRGRLAVHRKWSVNDAILTGDALIALSVNLASAYGESVLKAVAQSALELCDGEHMDVTFNSASAREEWYLKKIREKSASLFAAAMYCGALAGGGTSKDVDALNAFGENFGMAYQLRDDLIDLEPRGTQLSKDLASGRINLALIHFYRNGNSEDRERLDDVLNRLINDTNAGRNVAEDLIRLLKQKGSIDYCEQKIDEYLLKAVESISALKDSEYKSYLVEMTRALKTGG